MTDYKELKSIPVLMDVYKTAMKDAVPGIGNKHLAKNNPTSAFRVSGVSIDPQHLADYNAAIGRRLTNELPLTYPYVLTFPVVMSVLTAPDSPVAAMGLVHLSNVIEQTRALTVDDVLDVRVHGDNLRPHDKGVLLDIVTVVSVEGEDIWTQTSSFLAKGAKLSSSSPYKDAAPTNGRILEPIAFDAEQQDPISRVRVTGGDILTYANASGDKNPIHVSNVGAKAFGFPSTIAHGMWTAAMVLSKLEGVLPAAARYTVEFAKPVVLPSTVAVFASPAGDKAYPVPSTWELQVRKASKPETLHMSATVEKVK